MKYVVDPKLLELRFGNGMLLLPFYHCRIMGLLNNPLVNDVNGKRYYSKKIISLFKGIFHIPIKKRKIIGISNAGLEHYYNDKWKNALHGYYYDLYPNDFLMIESWDAHYKWKSFDSCDSFSTIIIFLVAFSDIVAFIMNKLKPIKCNDFDYMSSVYPFITKDRQSFDSYFVSVFSHVFELFLNYVNPRIILLVCGSYGGVAGIICKVAKRKGITVIDTQHGQVYRYKAYSASAIVKNSKEYKEYLPDFFYSFGDFWSNCVDWQYKKVSVGNPYLNEFVNRFSGTEKTIDFLIISQPHSKYLQHDFIKALAAEFPSSQIVVRLHHSESYDLEKDSFVNNTNVKVVSPSKNLYLEMSSSRYVIGWCSTCLYELLAFGRQPIIVRDPVSVGSFPEEIGFWIDEPKDIREIESKTENLVHVDDYWNRNFEKTVRAHLDSLLK